MIRKKLSPRQKMINLMYVVLMAMLALNVSSDVLEGFSLVDEGLNRTKVNSTTQNEAIYKELDAAMKQNPEKTRQWYEKAQQVRKMSDSLYTLAENLKWEIVREADGSDADLNNIEGRDNLEAATHVMLASGVGKGGQLKKAIETYRDGITKMINDEGQKKIIRDNSLLMCQRKPSCKVRTGRSICLRTPLWLLLSPCSPSCRPTCAMLKVRCSTS